MQAGQLDKDYLSQWAHALRITDFLGKALEEIA